MGKRLDRVQTRIDEWILPEFSGRPAQSITESDITKFKAKLKLAEYKETTIDRFLSILRRAYSIGLREKIQYGPKIEFYGADNPRQGFFTREQLEVFCNHLPEDVANPVKFGGRSAWRTPSETLTRMWRHANLDEGLVWLEPGEAKSEERRLFPFTPELFGIFSRQWEIHQALLGKGKYVPYVFHHDGQPLFYSKNGSREVKPSSYFRDSWERACKETGLKRIRHDLCRTGIRDMDQCGLSHAEGMALSGRKTESIYPRYNVVDESRLRQAVKKLENLRNFKVSSK